MSRIAEALSRANKDLVEPATTEKLSSWAFNTQQSAPVEASPAQSVLIEPPRGLCVPGSTADSDYTDRLVTAPLIEPAVVEQYRRLAAALHRAQGELAMRRLLVTSALADEGKTLVACNLALTLSNSFGRRVLLVDGDLRQPSIHKVFGIAEAVANGPTDGSGSVSPVKISPPLSLLAPVRPEPDSLRIVTGGLMERLMSEAASQYDWVIVDAPPAALVSDTHVLASMVDRVILVVNSGTPYPAVQKAIAEIGPERVVGAVLNRVDPSMNAYGGAAYYDDKYDA